MMTTDPVCRMKLDPEIAAARMEFGGVTYYFCSDSCRHTFASDPQRYVADLRLGTPPDDGPGQTRGGKA